MQRLGFFTRLGVDGNRHDILGYISRECEMQQEFYSCSQHLCWFNGVYVCSSLVFYVQCIYIIVIHPFIEKRASNGLKHNYKVKGFACTNSLMCFVHCSMRITLTRALSALCLSTVVLLMWTVLRQSHVKHFTQTCHHPEQFQEELHKLANRQSFVLHRLYTIILTEQKYRAQKPFKHDQQCCVNYYLPFYSF